MRAQDRAVLKALVEWSPQSTKALGCVHDGSGVIRDPGRVARRLRSRGLLTSSRRDDEKSMYWFITDAGIDAMGWGITREEPRPVVVDARDTLLWRRNR